MAGFRLPAFSLNDLRAEEMYSSAPNWPIDSTFQTQLKLAPCYAHQRAR